MRPAAVMRRGPLSNGGARRPADDGLALLATLPLVARSCAEGGSSGCPGSAYPGPVVSLCEENWPRGGAGQPWVVLFHAEWCGHCQTLQPEYLQLARRLQGEGIAVGAVDCAERANHGVCRRHNVSGYPTIAAVGRAPPKFYHSRREAAPMADWALRELRARGAGGSRRRSGGGL